MGVVCAGATGAVVLYQTHGTSQQSGMGARRLRPRHVVSCRLFALSDSHARRALTSPGHGVRHGFAVLVKVRGNARQEGLNLPASTCMTPYDSLLAIRVGRRSWWTVASGLSYTLHRPTAEHPQASCQQGNPTPRHASEIV